MIAIIYLQQNWNGSTSALITGNPTISNQYNQKILSITAFWLVIEGSFFYPGCTSCHNLIIARLVEHVEFMERGEPIVKSDITGLYCRRHNEKEADRTEINYYGF